ncbi:MBL fold metallo-hydrolase [Nocardioides speluncae]|uniref:MBL fold metallo-hydrolase n=1 Tax=Nocardioides speluncae TaxID=2670337 RepID=UPI000D689EC7|nr:MBL fold metallo-hydrolase [Nocardioides speluncae]
MTDDPAPEAAQAEAETEAEAFTFMAEPVQAALRAASAVVGTRPGVEGVDAVATIARTRQLLDLINSAPALRAVVTQRLAAATPEHLNDPHVRQLLATDSTVAATGVKQVEQLLDEARRAARTQRRATRRAKRGTATERERRRESNRLERYRDERNRARRQAEQLQRELSGARDDLASLAASLDHAVNSRDTTERQLDTLRASLTSTRQVAQLLTDALAKREPEQSADPVRDYTYGTDSDGDEKEDIHPMLGRAVATLPEGLRATALATFAQIVGALAHPPRLTGLQDRSLRVDVLGGGNEIGGSSVLITAAGTRILVDCGTRPDGHDEKTLPPAGIDRALQAPLDAVIVTHAHNDHGGWVPALVAAQPDLPIFTTSATADLLSTMWLDSAKVLARNVETREKWTGGILPPYSVGDVYRAVDRFIETPFGRVVTLGNLTVELFRAGHIVGAAGVVVTAGGQRVVVTGDVSKSGQKTVKGIELPSSAIGADLMLLESTYADSRHLETRGQVVGNFIRDVTRVAERGGVALVPSFALGRAQEVALLCAEYLPGVDVLVDGLARDVSDVYERHPGPSGTKIEVFSGRVRKVGPGETSLEVSRFRSGVVIATSGMLTAGPAVAWARRVLPDPNSALLVVGYQDAESPGARLLKLAVNGGGVFDLPRQGGGTEQAEVHAKVDQYQLGAHANADELAVIATEAGPKNLMLVHGAEVGQAKFAVRLRTMGQRPVLSGVWTPPN